MRTASAVKGLGALAVLLTAGVASAGMLLDPGNGGMTGWRDQVMYTDLVGPYYDVYARVEYSVFAPGDFHLGVDPSGGRAYVYAYQIFNRVPPPPAMAQNQATVTSFSIKLTDNDRTANNGFVPDAGVDPSASRITSTVVVWDFNSPSIGFNPAQNSDILVFTSPHSPVLNNGRVTAGVTITHKLPSPGGPAVPEPATLALLSIAAAGVFFKKR